MSVLFLNRIGQANDNPVTRRFVVADILYRRAGTPTGGPASMNIRDAQGNEHLLTADEFSPRIWEAIRVGTILELQVVEQIRVWSGPRVVSA